MTQILFSFMGRLIAKISILTITVYNSDTILIKTPPYTQMPILKHFTTNIPQNSQTIKRKYNMGEYHY